MSAQTVIFVVPSLESGGAERVLVALMNNIDREKFFPVLLSVRGNGTLSPLIASGIRTVMLDHSGPLPLCFFRLLRALCAEKPAMVVSTVTPMNFITLLAKPFLPRTGFIVREATMPSFFMKKFYRYKPVIWMMFQLYRLADAVICPARVMMDELQAIYHLKRNRFFWLPNPVNVMKIRAGLTNLPARTADREFVSVGRLVPEKGYDRLIPALKDFNPGGTWHLTLVGEGPERARLEGLIAAYDLGQNITLAGFRDDPWPIVAAADLFLLPSRLEGLPNVVLESLACGTPVIAMKEAGGIAEIAASAQPGDIRIVETIMEMVSTMELAPVKEPAAVRLPELYTPETINRRFGLFLDRVAGKQRFEDL